MKTNKPAGGDMPPDFEDKQPFTVAPSDKLRKTNVDLARHNLQVKLKRFKEEAFRAAKEVVRNREEKSREMDAFVRKVYADEPRKMAEWEVIWTEYELGAEELEE